MGRLFCDDPYSTMRAELFPLNWAFLGSVPLARENRQKPVSRAGDLARRLLQAFCCARRMGNVLGLLGTDREAKQRLGSNLAQGGELGQAAERGLPAQCHPVGDAKFGK